MKHYNQRNAFESNSITDFVFVVAIIRILGVSPTVKTCHKHHSCV